jgi:hypothetical protein
MSTVFNVLVIDLRHLESRFWIARNDKLNLGGNALARPDQGL